MTSIQPIRDPHTDHLLTPQNAALLVIDYQPAQIGSIRSMDPDRLVRNITVVAKIAQAYGLPVVLSTVNVQDGRCKGTIPQLREVLAETPTYDRTSINAWEDAEFVKAVKATGRRKLVVCALWTEACLTFPTLDALDEGYDVYAVTDAVGGTSRLAHHAALHRVEQAGARLVSITQLLCELQRDWNRQATVSQFLELMFADGAFVKLQ